MSVISAQLIEAFETFSAEEQPVAAKEILRRLPPFDSGPLDDEDVARAGDQLAARLG